MFGRTALPKAASRRVIEAKNISVGGAELSQRRSFSTVAQISRKADIQDKDAVTNAARGFVVIGTK